MSQININPNPEHVPRRFNNGTWSCCARSHSRPENLTAAQRLAYEALYPHITDWEEELPDGTTDIIFGIGSAEPAFN
jgi:hypothetical protein